ncbi:MAG: beta-galactosidase [Lachnospiraceae bacterium]|nr:beta-galactosidase [Lachnospiraceae bacterium]
MEKKRNTHIFECKDKFYLDGEPFRIISGSIHYFRTIPEYWYDRLRKLKEMGCNTVETYVAWNIHEAEQGKFDFTGIADIGRFLKTAAKLGLFAIVRPSPYICAEWEFGGLPGWLLKDANLRVRTSSPEFLQAVEPFYDRLFEILTPLQVNYGGPIILMQVENEYGSYGTDGDYLDKLKNMMRERGVVVPLITSDGPTDESLSCGTVEGAHPTANFGSRTRERFDVLKKYAAGGPLMCTEFWCGWFDYWGNGGHATGNLKQSAEDLAEMLKLGNVNFYMFEGGTNFGFMNGSNYYDRLTPDVTSYDYDAILTEDGQITEKYRTYQRIIWEHLAEAGKGTEGNKPEKTEEIPGGEPEKTVRISAGEPAKTDIAKEEKVLENLRTDNAKAGTVSERQFIESVEEKLSGAGHGQKDGQTVKAVSEETASESLLFDKKDGSLCVNSIQEEGKHLVPKRKAYGLLPVQTKVNLFDILPEISQPVESPVPVSMERLGQNYGYILYRAPLKREQSIESIRFEGANDRAIVFVDREQKAVYYDRELMGEHELKVEFAADSKVPTLDILVENMGRVNYGPMMDKQCKGIDGGVLLNGHFHHGWEIWPLPLDDISRVKFPEAEDVTMCTQENCDMPGKRSYAASENDFADKMTEISSDSTEAGHNCGGTKKSEPAFYRFEFDVDEPGDTFLDFAGFGKGCVWVNGFNIGRFWEIGPQRRLYIPAPLLRQGKNTIILFETDGKAAESIELKDEPDLG